MKHIGIVCPALSGHLNPLVSLGKRLKSRGYRVSIVSLPDAEAHARAAGLGFVPTGAEEFPVGSMAKLTKTLSELPREKVLAYTIALFTDRARVILESARQAVANAGIDALIVDQSSASGGSVADAEGIPFITVSIGGPLNEEPDVPSIYTPWDYDPTDAGRERNAGAYAMLANALQPVMDVVNEYRRRWNLPHAETYSDLFSPEAQIMQMPAFLDFPRRAAPPNFFYTGPFVDLARNDHLSFPFERLNEKPLVYASLGTLHSGLTSVFEAIAMACSDLDVQLVISLGNRDAADIPDLPGSPIVVPFAPQLEMLKRASLLITSAGMNTTLEALSLGIPMVAIPLDGDQPGIGSRIAHHGFGTVLDRSTLTAENLRDSVINVLNEPRYREAAKTARQRIEQENGLDRAADIVERVVVAGRRKGALAR